MFYRETGCKGIHAKWNILHWSTFFDKCNCKIKFGFCKIPMNSHHIAPNDLNRWTMFKSFIIVPDKPTYICCKTSDERLIIIRHKFTSQCSNFNSKTKLKSVNIVKLI